MVDVVQVESKSKEMQMLWSIFWISGRAPDIGEESLDRSFLFGDRDIFVNKSATLTSTSVFTLTSLASSMTLHMPFTCAESGGKFPIFLSSTKPS